MQLSFYLALLLPLVTSSLSKEPHHPHRPHPNHPDQPNSHHHVRQAVTASDPSSKPDWTPQKQQDYHINPSWSPDANNIAPISLDGVSPWNDNGHSEMVEPPPGPFWAVCPLLYLDCRKCPQDFRCTATSSSSSSTTTPLLQSTQQPIAQGEPAALTGPQLSSPKFVSAAKEKPQCPLQKCSLEQEQRCGPAAKCKKGFCVCPRGKKGTGTALRGWTWPSALTVYVEPGVACNVTCDDRFCSEIGRAKGCGGLQTDPARPVPVLHSKPALVIPPLSSSVTSQMGTSPSSLATSTSAEVPVPLVSAGGHGVVQFPQVSTGPDYVAGVADPGDVSEAT